MSIKIALTSLTLVFGYSSICFGSAPAENQTALQLGVPYVQTYESKFTGDYDIKVRKYRKVIEDHLYIPALDNGRNLSYLIGDTIKYVTMTATDEAIPPQSAEQIIGTLDTIGNALNYDPNKDQYNGVEYIDVSVIPNTDTIEVTLKAILDHKIYELMPKLIVIRFQDQKHGIYHVDKLPTGDTVATQDATSSTYQLRVFDAEGRLINVDGHLIDEKGRLIDSRGRLVNEAGHLIDEQGRLINENGHLVDSRDRLINEEGHLVDSKDRLINEKGQLVDEKGQLVDEKGNVIAPTS